MQDALVSALKSQVLARDAGDPAAWLYRTAHNRAVDLLRRDRRLVALVDGATLAGHGEAAGAGIGDSELRVLLMCCHPVLSPASRVALALNVAGGLTPPQIARALLVSEPALRQMLVRAKQRLRDSRVELDLPDADLDERLDAALDTLYLMFNEGYCALDGDDLVRPELCREAMRLCGLLLDSPRTAEPRVCALGALLFLQGARLGGRTDTAGNAVRLADQNRASWDRRMIAVEFDLLERAARRNTLSVYHLEAEIASYHARAASVETTDWDNIVRAYDLLIAMHPSPVVQLNRAVAVAARDGVASGLAALDALEGNPLLATYPFFHTTRGQFLAQAGRAAESQAAYRRALSLATSRPFHRFIGGLLDREHVEN